MWPPPEKKNPLFICSQRSLPGHFSSGAETPVLDDVLVRSLCPSHRTHGLFGQSKEFKSADKTEEVREGGMCCHVAMWTAGATDRERIFIRISRAQFLRNDQVRNNIFDILNAFLEPLQKGFIKQTKVKALVGILHRRVHRHPHM